MAGDYRSPGAIRRLSQFLSERLGDVSVVGFAPDDAATERRQMLHEYRRRVEAELPPVPPPAPRGRRARLGPAPPPGANWIPIGPLAVRNGQAATKPPVSGRVAGLAVSSDGRRVYAATANGGVWCSEDTGRTWVPTMDELELNPTVRQVDSLACGAIAMVEGAGRDTDRLYVGTGEGHVLAGLPASGYFGAGMLLSTNGGASWTREAASVSLEGAGVFNVAVDPADPQHAIAATTRGIFRRTAASAATATPWVQEAAGAVIGVGVAVTSVVSYRRGTDTHFLVGTNGGIVADWTSAAGAWSALGTGFVTANAGRMSLAVSASTPPVVYALVATTASGGAFHGLHRLDLADPAPRPWRTVATGPANVFGPGPNFQGSYDQCIAVDPANVDRVYLGGSTALVAGEWSGALYRTDIATTGTGAARTFAATNTLIGGSVHADLHELTFKPGGPDLWVGCDGGVFTSTNPAAIGDRIFEPRNAGLGTLTLNGMAHHPSEESFLFCGAQDCGGLRYTGGEVWDHQLPGDGGDTVWDWNNPTRFLNIYTNASVRQASTDGARYVNVGVGPALGAENCLFYPPMATAPPSANATDAQFVAFGAQRVWVTTTFGGVWNPLPAHPTAGGFVRSIAVVSPTRLYAGWTTGGFARYDLTGAGWTVTDHTRAGEARDITCIAIDRADASGQSVYVTIAGAGASHVWHLDSSTGTPGTWTDRSGAAPNTLLNIQHSAILVDPATPTTLYAAADLGVWRSTDSGTGWSVFSANLPDAAVLDLDLHPLTRVLRATTHGRGAFELPLGAAQPGIELVLRTNVLDQRRRDARAGVTPPGDLTTTTALDASPDIAIDAPNASNVFAVDASRTPNLVELAETLTGNRVLASVPEAPVVTRVHVTVRNRGVTAADDVRVALLLGPYDGSAPAELPAGFTAAATAGTNVEAGGWKTVGIHTISGLKAGGPAVVTFELRSDQLPVASDADGKDFALLALVHHAADAFPAASSTAVHALVTTERRSAARKVTASAAQVATTGGGAAAAAAAGAQGSAGLVVPLTNALLAFRRLDDIVDQLERKVKSTRVSPGFAGFRADVNVHPVERRVLAMATEARAALRSGPTAAVPRDLPGFGIGSYALLGALAFELPTYAGMLAPGGGWVADMLRRGTPDPNRSLVKVPSSELPLAVGRIGIAAAAAGGEQDRLRAFSAGMLAAVAAGVAVAPQQADLHAVDTNADWSRHAPSVGATALARHIRHRFLGGEDRPSTVASWLPPPSDVPEKLWTAYLDGIKEVYRLPADRPKGFKAFEDTFDEGDWLTTGRLASGYGLALEDVRSTAWPWPAYWGLITPILLGPSIAMLAAQTQPNAKKFFDKNADVDERAVFELLMLSMGIGSVMPFLYSMILWGAVDEHTEPFVNAMLMGLVRGALFGATLGTADDDLSSAARWLGLFAPMASLDVYSLIRALIAGGRRPGVRTVFLLQTIPSLTGLATLGVSGLLKGLGVSDGDDWPFWLIWGLHTAAVVFGIGIPVAMALSNGGGWRSWFLRDVKLPSLSAAVATAALPTEPVARARVYDTSTLWPDPLLADPDLADFAYPSGTRPLVRVWWEGDGALQISHVDDTIVLRRAAGDVRVAIPPGTTAAGLVALLTNADPGVRAEIIGENEVLTPVLPWPRTLADPGDTGPAAFAPIARVRFDAVGTSKGDAHILHHAPRADLSTLAGLSPSSIAAMPVLPTAELGDLAGSGLGAAADLAALLATAAAPTFGAVTTAGDGLPPLGAPAVGEVVHVFRRWNLDERRLEEWRTLVSGGAALEPAPHPDPLARTLGGYAGPQAVGADVLAAMGWLPVWRAWLAIATDPGADAGAPFAQPSTPLVRFPDGSVRRPTNAQLTEGVRRLLDLGAA